MTDHRYTKRVCDMCGTSVLIEDLPPTAPVWAHPTANWQRYGKPGRTADICPACLAKPMAVGEVLAFLEVQAPILDAEDIVPARVRPRRQTPPAIPSRDQAVIDELMGRLGNLTDADLDVLNSAGPETLCRAVCQPAEGPREECRCKSCGGEKHGAARVPVKRWA